MTRLILCAFLLLLAAPAAAQVVTNPTSATFAHPAAEFALTSGYRMEFFQCAALTGGVCVGRAAAPFQAGSTVPKALVTGPATARVFTFASVPPGNPLPSFPAGVGFVSTLLAIGDPATGGTGESARSGDSNPFFAQGRTPVGPTFLVVQ